MCHTATGAAYDRPLHTDDIQTIVAPYERCLGGAAVTGIVQALTDAHVPQPAVLIAVLEMAHRAKHKDCGLYPWPMMPFSALDLDTLERVQTEDMAAFHTVFESMALAERNMRLLDQVLASQLGLQLRLVCDCGCVSDGFDVDILGDPAYAAINRVRSLAESVGTRVVRVPTFSDPAWTRRNLDMGPSEVTSYERMARILKSLPHRAIALDPATERAALSGVLNLHAQAAA